MVLLKFSQKSQENTCVGVFFLTVTFLKERLQHRSFPMNFAKFLRTPFFTEHLRWLLLFLFAKNHQKDNTEKPRQISPYDYMWKLNFVLARRDSFPPGIWLDLHAFSLDFSL